MKQYWKSTFLPPLILGCGIVTLFLRLWLLSYGEDDKGLLPAGNAPDILSWVVTCLVLVLLTAGTWKLQEATKYRYNFPASYQAALGMALAGLSFFITSLVELVAGTDTMGTISAIVGLLAVPAIMLLAYWRLRGMRPSVLYHGLICLYLMLHLVSHYRLWSSAPQVQSYGFELLAIVCVTLACYQRAAFDADHGNRRSYAFCTLAALYFALAALPGCDNKAFFIGCAAWMFTTPCNLVSLPGNAAKREAQ